MSEKYSVYSIATKEITETDAAGLKDFLKTCFPNGNQKFWDHLYIKRLQNSNYPYTNGIYTITCLSIKHKKSKSLDFSAKFKVAANLDPGACQKRLFNQWTIYNSKTGVYEIFHNLAAIARALNLNYAWLYSRIRYNTSFEIGHYVFTFDTILQSEYYKDKLQKLV